MRIAYLDCFSGISGDMFLGALVDAGVSASLLEETVAGLDLGATLEIRRVSRSGISATKVDVVVAGEKDLPREEYWAGHGHAHGRRHSHDHRHGHGHERGHEHSPQHGHEHQEHERRPPGRTGESALLAARSPGSGSHPRAHRHGRGLSEIKKIIAGAQISHRAKRVATAAFEALGAAEAKIHDTEIEKIHFHEVGAVDALVDIICGAVAAQALGVERWVCSPLNVGGGTVECAHGRFPIPAPATLELLKGAPLYSCGAQVELVTPTGAALVRALNPEFRAFPRMMVSLIGYGAGSRDLPGAANVLRISVGDEISEHDTAGAAMETVAVLEASVDDLNPQVFGYVMERARAEGALDVFAAPVQMKKNRPGMLLTVLARPGQAQSLARLLFAETTTLGVRIREERRLALERRWVPVRTRWGEVRMKVANLNGTLANCVPEYEDCRRIAAGQQVPLKSVMQEAMREYLAAAPEANNSERPSAKRR